MYSIHNEGQSVVTERFIRTLKNKIYKHITSISKNVYIDKLDDIVNKFNNAYHRTIKVKAIYEIQACILALVKKMIKKILNLKLVLILEC